MKYSANKPIIPAMSLGDILTLKNKGTFKNSGSFPIWGKPIAGAMLSIKKYPSFLFLGWTKDKNFVRALLPDGSVCFIASYYVSWFANEQR